MCGRYALTSPQSAVLEHFAAEPSPKLAEKLGNLGPRWNIPPTTDIPVVLRHDGRRLLAPLRWGFIPRWAKSPSDGPLLINARSESVADKPAFREAARERRCLIPANGFYEWLRGEDGSKRPFWIRPADGPDEGALFAFAGVWEIWRGPQGARIAACAILTGPANADIAPIHHRAPVVISPQDHALWLGEDGKGAAALLEPRPEGFWAAHEVSKRVNGVKDDDPQLIAPLED